MARGRGVTEISAVPAYNPIFVVLETRLFQPCNTRVVFEKEARYASLGKELILTEASQKRAFVRGAATPQAYRALISEF